jgi:hypothetical protein
MKFTLSWLKEHLDTKATLAELRDGLTMLGLEVEGITNPAESLKGFVVGYVSRRCSIRMPIGCGCAGSIPAAAWSRSCAARPTRAPA